MGPARWDYTGSGYLGRDTEGTIPGDYTPEGITGYLRQAGGSGTLPLVRYLNAGTASHYYSTTGDAPSGYTAEATLGYLESTAGPDLVPLARYYNASTGDYLLDTSTTPPSGYTHQATLGYLRLTGAGSGGSITFTYDAGTNGKGRRTGLIDFAGSAVIVLGDVGSKTTWLLTGIPVESTRPEMAAFLWSCPELGNT